MKPKPKRKARSWQSQRQRTLSWVSSSRLGLIAKMGGVCRNCGSDENLHVHHYPAKSWQSSKCNRWVRLARYKRDLAEGTVYLLCGKCHYHARLDDA
jgi:hypothetical protein